VCHKLELYLPVYSSLYDVMLLYETLCSVSASCCGVNTGIDYSVMEGDGRKVFDLDNCTSRLNGIITTAPLIPKQLQTFLISVQIYI